jgi:PAS domain S-box-containing protein
VTLPGEHGFPRRRVLFVLGADEPLLRACRAVAESTGRLLVDAAEPAAIAGRLHGAAELVGVLDGTRSDDSLVHALVEIRGSWAAPPAALFVAGDERSSRTVELLEAGADDVLPHPALLRASGTPGCLFERRLRMAIAAAEARRLATELEQVRASLTVQKAFFEHLFESAPEGIVVVDREDRILRANGEFCRMFGFTQPEIIGRPINALVAPQPFRAEADSITRRVRSREAVAVETVRYRKDGSPIDVSLLATPVDAGNDEGGAFGIYRDITEAKRAERSLRDNEERYRYLFEQNPLPMLVFDWETHRFLAVNHSALEQYGYSRDEFLERTIFDIRPPEDAPLLREHLGQRPSGLRRSGTWRHLRKDGTVIWVEIVSLQIDFAGRPARLVLANDVTKRLAAERRLQDQARELEQVNEALHQRTTELEEAMRARSRLYASMSHELRTPISAIMLYNDLLLSGTLGALLPEQQEGLDHSQFAARHLLELVNDVLDLAQVDAGKLSVKMEEVGLVTFIGELLSTAHPLAASRGSPLIVSTPERGCRLHTDPRRLRQIMLNLLSNATKFGEGKPIELICLCHCAAGNGVTILVRDRGRGIAQEDQERIFDDFVQVGGHLEGGTGLGLPIARRLAELLGGSLTMSSTLGAGSEFRLVLPARLHDIAAPIGVTGSSGGCS